MGIVPNRQATLAGAKEKLGSSKFSNSKFFENYVYRSFNKDNDP